MSTVIVGNRLAALMSAQVEKIPFESGGVLVRVPTKVVKDWEVGPEDEVKVDIFQGRWGIIRKHFQKRRGDHRYSRCYRGDSKELWVWHQNCADR